MALNKDMKPSKRTSQGKHLGRATELGSITYYFTSENLYEVTCNCGVTFTVSTKKAKVNSLACKDCLRALRISHGKKSVDKQLAKMQALVGTEHNIHDLLDLRKPE